MSHETTVPATPREMVARARELRDRLRAEQATTEERTYHSQELFEAFRAAGFYRMLQPQRFGGFEVDLGSFYATIVELARGCPSTGWCVCLGSAHVLNFSALFPESVQQQVLGGDGHFVAPSRALPGGTATPTSDGWLINGRWDYCSGVPYATHALQSVMLPAGNDGQPRVGTALIARDDFTMLDDWGELIGLRGSGSHTTVAENIEIPRDWVVEADLNNVSFADTIGWELHGNPMYSGRNAGFFTGELTACAVGIARAALDEYVELMQGKQTVWIPQVRRTEDPHYQMWFGRAQTLVDSAEAGLMRLAELFHEFCEQQVSGGDEFSLGDDMRLASMALQSGLLVTEAMDLMIRTAGSSAMKNGTKMQRYWRDFSTYRSHIGSMMLENFAVRHAAATLTGVEIHRPGALRPAGQEA